MSDTAVPWAMEPEVVSAIRQRRWFSFAMLVLVFGAGTVIGSGLTMIAVNDKYDAHWKNAPPRSCDRVLPAMQRELNLSEEQAAKVTTILDEHDKAMGKIWIDMGPKWREQLKRLEDQVNGVLTTDQQTKWHAWVEQRRPRPWHAPPHGKHHRHRMEGDRDSKPRVDNGGTPTTTARAPEEKGA